MRRTPTQDPSTDHGGRAQQVQRVLVQLRVVLGLWRQQIVTFRWCQCQHQGAGRCWETLHADVGSIQDSVSPFARR